MKNWTHYNTDCGSFYITYEVRATTVTLCASSGATGETVRIIIAQRPEIRNVGRYFSRPDDGFSDKSATQNVVILCIHVATLSIWNASLFYWFYCFYIFRAKDVPACMGVGVQTRVCVFENNVLYRCIF